MDKEQQLYDTFVNVLAARLEGEPSAQDLAVILNFLKYNNIQASAKHKGVNKLMNKLSSKLPFEEEDELPLRVVK